MAPASAVRGATLARVFLLAFVVFGYFMPRWADWNIDSRFDLSRALIDKHSVRIDAYHFNTWDKAVYKGHYYSDKAPGTALLGAAAYGVFALARSAPLTGSVIRHLEASSAWNPVIQLGKLDTQSQPAAPGRNLGGCQRTGVAGNAMFIPWGNRLVPPFQDWALSKYVVTVATVGLLSAIFVAFFFWFLGFFLVSAALRWLLTGLLAVATVGFPYSTVFYSHELSAAFLFVAFALLLLVQRGSGRPWMAYASGFLLGMALLTEYTVAPIIAVIGLYALWVYRRRLSRVGWLAAAAAVPVAALLIYNYACFGSPFDTGYSHDFCWSAAQGAGFAGFTAPKLQPLWDLTFGSYRGLFYMSPFLLLALPGLVLMVRSGYRFEAALCFVVAAGFILLISSYWGWNGVQVDRPRYLMPVVPFLAFPVAFLFHSLRSGLGWLVVALASLWSLFATWVQFLGGELFPSSWLRDPIFDYSLPNLSGNHIPPNAGFFLGLAGWESLLPLVVLLGIISAWQGGAGFLRLRRRLLVPRPASR